MQDRSENKFMAQHWPDPASATYSSFKSLLTSKAQGYVTEI